MKLPSQGGQEAPTEKPLSYIMVWVRITDMTPIQIIICILLALIVLMALQALVFGLFFSHKTVVCIEKGIDPHSQKEVYTSRILTL